jgi:hypothetical protein
LWAGELEAVWRPDEHTRVLRRRLSRREQLVRSRSRSKNEVHAVLMRRLVGRCPFSDLFGKAGREWLRGLELPVEERETIEASMRHIEFLDAEIAEVERLIAKQVLLSPDARHLLTVPGVNVICAATFLAAIGDIRRFRTSRELVGYLGLDPKVRQSGSAPARGGRISKQGSPQARWALVEAAWSVVQQPGPLRRVLSADPRPSRVRRRDRRDRPQARMPVLVPAHPRRELRPPTTLADRQEAPQARAQSRCPAIQQVRCRCLDDQPRDARSRAQARRTSRGVLRAHGPRLAGHSTEESGRERDTGARISRPSKGKAARQTQSS